MPTTGTDGQSRSPIFIVGVHRSGTTLLRYMLSSSPRIYIPPESDFIPRFFGRAPDEHLDRDRVARMLDLIFTRYRFAKEWQGESPEPDRFLEEMEALTAAAFLDTLYRKYARQHGAVRWGDKTPIYTSYLQLIDRLFPDAQVLHVLRDGRDVALSTLDKWGGKEPHVDIYYAARIWVRRIRQARWASGKLGPRRYRELRYEDLVSDPESELRAICKFLSEPYLPEMAQQHRYAREHVSPGAFHAPVREPPDPGRVGRWRREMSAEDQRLYHHVAGALLEELGYPITLVGRFSPREQARLLALRTKYEVLQAGRHVAQAAGLVPPIYGPPVPRRSGARGE
jgi:hypothetical protein